MGSHTVGSVMLIDLFVQGTLTKGGFSKVHTMTLNLINLFLPGISFSNQSAQVMHL